MTYHQEYFDKAASWATDAQSSSMRSRRIAWTIGGVAVAIAALEAVALAMLVPLKTVQPITLLVDRQTGFVQALDPQTPRRVAADDALTQSFLAQYVTGREGFDRATIATAYRRVALLSSGSARSTYLAEMPATNPSSPFNRYPGGGIVSVRVKSVSRLNRGVALVRFDTQQQAREGSANGAQPWVAVIRYRYTDAPMTLEDRLVNPLGFQVLSYRRDPEAAPVQDVAPAIGITAVPVRTSAVPEAASAALAYTPAAPTGPTPDANTPAGSPLASGAQ